MHRLQPGHGFASMEDYLRRLAHKTRLFVCLLVLANVGGNTLLSLGMREAGPLGGDPWSYLHALLEPRVASGVVLLACAMFSQMALLSWADLTYVIPVTAFAYVLTALSGTLLLDEAVTAAHWIGILLITGGVALVSRTAPRSVEW